MVVQHQLDKEPREKTEVSLGWNAWKEQMDLNKEGAATWVAEKLFSRQQVPLHAVPEKVRDGPNVESMEHTNWSPTFFAGGGWPIVLLLFVALGGTGGGACSEVNKILINCVREPSGSPFQGTSVSQQKAPMAVSMKSFLF